MKTLWMFPGQGSQRQGMLTKVDPLLKKKVTELTGIELQDTNQGYQDSVQIQLSILILQMDQVAKLKALSWQPNLVAGHSLGVFAAAYAAGVISQEDAIKTVALRAKLMQNAYPHDYGMGVIVGLLRKEVTQIVDDTFDESSPVYVSNQNSQLQVTVSGNIAGIQTVLDRAKAQGAQKAKLLRVPVPSHSPLMRGVAKKLTEALKNVNLEKPNCIYLADYNGHASKNIKNVTYDLGNNLSYPVYWDVMMDIAKEYLTDSSVEFSPGHVMTNLLKAKDPEIKSIALADMAFEDAEFLLNKWAK
ncbi:acyltransferase domain-containing protein [Pediococcus parvulus]|uniref:[acyl-carrier-protein] S-malonyltransferase n=1 Tax=Pediococcus parvulus TaxID=54062 RepID=A0AAP5TA63_9LACO|nr:acyltransferase domain-containing protein [Pediococcus parvulus]MDV7693974.1 acyltransferase domain-containing protein [Pediococcus parvulus]OAD63413.1 acyl transferase [Pediococcus parvulus]